MEDIRQEIKTTIFKYLKRKLSLFGIKKVDQFSNNFDLLNNEIYDSLNYMDIATSLEQKNINLNLALNKNIFPKSLNDFYKIANLETKNTGDLNKNKKINLKKILKTLCIKKNDNILIHSSFAKLINYNIDEKFFFQTIRNTIGKKGTIFVVGTNFKKYFADKFNKTKTLPHNEFGILSKFIFKNKKSIRSGNPFDSLIGLGNQAKICKKNNFCGFDNESPWSKLIDIKAKIILVDIDFFYCSYLHRIEYKMNVPYRKIKNFNKKYGKYALHARKKRNLFLHYNKILKEKKLNRSINSFNFDDINFYSISCKALDKYVSQLILQNKNYFLKK